MQTKLTPKERFCNILSFKPVDRLPYTDWGIRGATMREWLKQGFPPDANYRELFGFEPFNHGFPVNFGMIPPFEAETLETDGVYKIWRDETGAVRKDFIVTENEGFVTRSWLSFPVTDRASFVDMKKRYIAGDPARTPKDFELQCNNANNSEGNTCLRIPFLFFIAREWVGFENLCLMFYDDPVLIEEMFEFIADFVIEILKDKIKFMQIDLAEVYEDMAYKHAPMISPDMFKKFMFSHYKRVFDFLRSNGVKFISVDSDGFNGGIIPLWIEAGVDAMTPTEIAAGNDPVELRKQYPRFGMFGGIDKRVLAHDKTAVYNEVMSKVPFMLESGGFIPHIDHAIPHDALLSNYIYYSEIFKLAASGLPVEKPRD